MYTFVYRTFIKFILFCRGQALDALFIQRRSQLSPLAFEHLFSQFSYSFPQTTNTFKGRCILACDGSHIVYSTNAEILQDYNDPHIINHKGYNHMHLNGFVDVSSKAFVDAVLQPGQKPDEREAFHQMLDHFQLDDPQKYIVTADRGYESYDLIFHCELKHLNYVFRVKSPSSSKSMLSSFIDELPTKMSSMSLLHAFLQIRRQKS